MPARFLSIPHIQQQHDADCLAACAAMILAASGYRVRYSRLQRLLGTSEWGTPHGRIQRLSRISPDLRVIYQAGDVSVLKSYIDRGHPVGIFVDTEELPYWDRSTGHAVVVAGYSDQDFFVYDPAFAYAPITVTRGDLELGWQQFDSYFFVVQRV